MSNVNRHTVRRGNVVSKSSSRKARAAQIARADRHAYTKRDALGVVLAATEA